MIVYYDLSSGEVISEREIRFRASPVAPKAAEFWDDEYLAEWNAGVVNAIEVEPPEVEPPFYLSGNYSWDKSVAGEWTQVWEVIDPTLEQAKLFSRRRLDADCDAEALQPVEYDSKFWKGGFESAQGIKAVVDMSEFLELETVTLTDASDAEHSYSIAGAKGVAAAIGVAYQKFFMMRAAKRRAIADAETVAEALAVTWDDPS